MANLTTASLEELTFHAAEDDENERSNHRAGVKARLVLLRDQEPHRIVLNASFRLPKLPDVQAEHLERWIILLLQQALRESVDHIPG